MVDGVESIPLCDPSDGHASHAVGRGSPHVAALSEFIAGPENALVTELFSLLRNGAASVPPTIILFGAPSVGKTSLARALVSRLANRDGVQAAKFLTSKAFAREFVEALDLQDIDAWRRRLAETSVLGIDDVDAMAGNHATQEELARLLDLRRDHGRPMVLTSRLHPLSLEKLSPRLRSRLASALSVDVALPGGVARRVLVERLATNSGVPLSSAKQQSLAERRNASCEDLADAIARKHSTPVVAGDVSLHEPAARRATPEQHVAAIARRTARLFGVRTAELRGSSRRRSVARARSVAIYVARQSTDATLANIGDYFGGRDHSTVLYACRQVARRMNEDPQTRRAVQRLRVELAI